MDIGSLMLLVCLSIFVGILIGGVGIGGKMLVPMLSYILSIDVHVAVAAAMFSYMFSGIAGTLVRVSSLQRTALCPTAAVHGWVSNRQKSAMKPSN